MELIIGRRQALFGLLFSLGGCSALPASGPNARLVDPEDNRGLANGYQVVDLDAEVAAILSAYSGPSLADGFGNHPSAPSQQIGVGDIVSVTVFEAGSGGLFTSQSADDFTTGARQTVIPNQTVDRDGKISVPYAGNIRAAGRTPKQVAESIRVAFGSRALEPQVIVSIVTNAASTASVLGEVTSGGKVSLGIRGERILDVIASAGGIKVPEHEVIIRLIRGKKTASVSLRTIISRPSENIYVQPQDTIMVIRERPTFTALGAVSRQGTQPIETSDYAMSEALGAVGGLNDSRADTSGVFLFRFERAELVQALGDRIDPAVEGWGIKPDKSPHGLPVRRGYVYPIVYRVYMSNPASLLALSRVKMMDKDIIYVANAPSVEIEKFIGLVGQFYGAIRGPIALSAQITN